MLNRKAMLARYRDWQSLPAMFFAQAARLKEREAFIAIKPGRYAAVTWRQAADQVTALARSLRALGIAPGERVAMLCENRPEFPLAELGILSAGGIAVPAYTTNTVQDNLYILQNSGAKAAVVSTRGLLERMLPAAQSSGVCKTVIAVEPWLRAQTSGVAVHAFADLIADGAAREGDVKAWVDSLKREDTACIIHTSGTGGAPKGVMLSHGAIISNCMGAYEVLRELGLGDEAFLSFLPLSHSYEHMAGQFFPISIGARIYYAEGIEKLAKNMAEVRPTIMTAVPRLYETMQRRILAGVERASPLKRRLFEKTVELGRRAYEGKQPLGFKEKIVNLFLSLLVRRKVRRRFGGRLKAFVSGGAALPYEIGVFFLALGVRLLQGYGQTEAAPVVAVNSPGDNRLSTVGKPLIDVEVRIAEDGEILVKGELVMQGYWRDPEATAAAIVDGWLHTGDIGTIDEDGFITITDRKKDIIVISGGDNISPLKIEGRLTLEPEIAQAVVSGDKRPYLVALIVPDAEFARTWAEAKGKAADIAALAEDAEFRRAIGAAVDRVNGSLSVIEHVRRFMIAPEPFTTENAMLTPTLKVRRHKIRERYGEKLDALYKG